MGLPRKWTRSLACVSLPLAVFLAAVLNNVRKDCRRHAEPSVFFPGFETVVAGFDSLYVSGWPMVCCATIETSLSPTGPPYRTTFLYFSVHGVIVNGSLVLILSGCTAVMAYRAAFGRGRLQFSLRGLLAFTTVIAILLGVTHGSGTLSALLSRPPYISVPLILGILCAAATSVGFSRWLLRGAWSRLLALSWVAE